MGRLQAIRAEPHHFLACLPTAPTVVFGIDQAAPGLPAVGAPVVRHLVFAVQSTQRNAEPRIIAMCDGPVAYCRRTDICSGVERLLPPLKAIGRIEQDAHRAPGAVQQPLAETVLPVATQEAYVLEPYLQWRTEAGSCPHRPRAWMPLPVWEIWGVGRSPALLPKPEPAQVEAQ